MRRGIAALALAVACAAPAGAGAKWGWLGPALFFEPAELVAVVELRAGGPRSGAAMIPVVVRERFRGDVVDEAVLAFPVRQMGQERYVEPVEGTWVLAALRRRAGAPDAPAILEPVNHCAMFAISADELPLLRRVVPGFLRWPELSAAERDALLVASVGPPGGFRRFAVAWADELLVLRDGSVGDPVVEALFPALEDPDLRVRRLALGTVRFALHDRMTRMGRPVSQRATFDEQAEALRSWWREHGLRR